MKLKLQQACRVMSIILILSMFLGTFGPVQLGFSPLAKAEESVFWGEDGQLENNTTPNQEDTESTEEVGSTEELDPTGGLGLTVESGQSEELGSIDNPELTEEPIIGNPTQSITPELLITEIVVTTGKTPTGEDSGKPYQYVEIFNNTSQKIDLNDYQIQYFSEMKDGEFTGKLANPVWKISDKSIKPYSTLILWLKEFNFPNVPLSDFNDNYGVSLLPEQVFEVKLATAGQGLHQTLIRKVGIARPDGTLIISAHINDGGSDGGSDEYRNKSVIYKYVGSMVMERIANKQVATPGSLVPGQLQTPYNFSVKTDVEAVNLTWMSYGGTAFNIYHHPVSDPDQVIKTQTTDSSYRFENLTEDVEYVFWVTATLDADGNESPATSVVKATIGLLEDEPPGSVGSTPDLLITEVVLRTDRTPTLTDSGKPYQYVEIFNNTSQKMDLNDYQLQYFTNPPDFGGKPANTWKISNKSIEPKSTLVLWLKEFNFPNVGLWDFNVNYGVSLLPEQVFEVKLTTANQGFALETHRKIGIARPDGSLISSASINDGEKDGVAGTENKSIIYKSPGSGIEMVKMASKQTATPGSLVAEQISGPLTPAELKVESGGQHVVLTWEANDSSAVAYNIYYTGSPEPKTVTGVTNYKVEGLTNALEYQFRITALDANGNESPAAPAVKATPWQGDKPNPPAKPEGLAIKSGVNSVKLNWNPNTEPDLAGYRIYVNGTLFTTVASSVNTVNVAPLVAKLEVGRDYTLGVSAYDRAGNESEKSTIISGPLKYNPPSDNPTPELLITELVPETHSYAGHNAFQYIELYNNSAKQIDLKDYTISTGNWAKEVDQSFTVDPYDTAVIWVRKPQIQSRTINDFNGYYYLSYESKFVPDNKVLMLEDTDGLSKGKDQKVILWNPLGEPVVSAAYTDTDVERQASIIYSYPTNGSIEMEKVEAKQQEPKPGMLADGQVPLIEEKQPAPAAPSGVKASSPDGTGTVILTWEKNQESDIHKYNIYKNGKFEHAVPATQQEFVVYQLRGNAEYNFEVTAVNKSNMESLKSELVAITPTHQKITETVRTSYVKDPKYQAMWDVSEFGPITPGLTADATPQGLGYSKEKDWLFYVAYVDQYIPGGRPDILSIIDAKTDKLIKSVFLYYEDGSPYIGHSGGISVTPNYVYLVSEKEMYQIKLDDLIQAEDHAEIKFSGKFPTVTSASFSTYADGVLWVGEFHEKNDYNIVGHELKARDGVQHYAWITGYDLKGEQNASLEEEILNGKWTKQSPTPDYVFSIREKVQGITFVDDNTIVLSTSYGRGTDSQVFRYNNPLTEEPHDSVTIAGKKIPLWFLDGVSAAKDNHSLDILPMSEGLVHIGDYIYVNFESGANKYRHSTTYILDHLVKIDLTKWYGKAPTPKPNPEPNPDPDPNPSPNPNPDPAPGSTSDPSPSGNSSTGNKPVEQADWGMTKLNTNEQQKIRQLVEQQGQKANAQLTLLADAFEYHAAKDGKRQTVKIPVQLPTNKVPVGVYEVGTDGKLTYVGGKRTGDQIEVELTHDGTYVVLAYDRSFADLQSQHWAYEAVRQLSAMQIVAGKSATDFASQQEVTRAEFIAMLVRTLGLKSSGNASFADVPSDSWYAEAMAAAVEAGLIAGMKDGTLAPNKQVTREQMAVFLVRAYKIKTGEIVDAPDSMPFSDQEMISGWAKEGLSAAYQLGLVSGHANGMYMPQNTTTRAEAAKAIYNLLIANGEWF